MLMSLVNVHNACKTNSDLKHGGKYYIVEQCVKTEWAEMDPIGVYNLISRMIPHMLNEMLCK